MTLYSQGFIRRSIVMSKNTQRKQVVLGLTGVLLGLSGGLIFKGIQLDEDISGLLSVPGEILLRMYKVLTLPLVVSSVISAMARVQLRTSGRMFIVMVLYYLGSTLSAALIGVLMVAIVRPGDLILRHRYEDPGVQVSGLDTALDFVRNMFPTNLVQACFQLHRTVRVPESPSVFKIGLNASEIPRVLRREFEYSDGLNIFGVIVFCSVFGLVSGCMGGLAQTHVQFFSILNSICMRLAHIINWYFPCGVLFLLVHSCITGDDLGFHLADVRVYILTVLVGLFVHSFIVLPLCYYLVVKKSPLVFAWKCFQAIMVGFGTSDSVASAPVTISCLEMSGVDRRVTRFVLPIACAFNLDGTALYAAVGSIFVANLNGIQLNFEHYIIVGVVAALTSFANRGIPNAVVITMVLVLQSAGLSAKHLPVLLAVDWIMNRCRTAVNVFSQAIAAAVVAHAVRHDLEESQDALSQHHWEHVHEVGVVKRIH